MIELESAIHTSLKALSRTVEHKKRHRLRTPRLSAGNRYLIFENVSFCEKFSTFLAKLPFSHRSVLIKTAENISSLFCFFSLDLLYFVQDSCKKCQEHKDRLGLNSRMTRSKSFLSLFPIFFLWWWNWVCSDTTAESFSPLYCSLSFLFLA